MKKSISIHWFRQDLRLSDNPGLDYAADNNDVIPIYILDTTTPDQFKPGSATKWWLHKSLSILAKSLNNKLSIYEGNPIEIISNLVDEHSVSTVTWNRCYEPWQIDRDKKIKELLVNKDITVKSFNGFLLWEPWEIYKKDGTPYKVFTSFYKNGCLKAIPPRTPLKKPKNLSAIKGKNSVDISKLSLISGFEWYTKIENLWNIGENGAQKSLKKFIETSINDYKDGRNFPDKMKISKLSPHLHFGEISPNQIWYEIRKEGNDENIYHFCSELGWREFANSLLYYNPKMSSENLQEKFDSFPWKSDQDLLSAWQKGKTGIPMVDAGMRELWETGFMHNRVRMIVGSFLVKNLMIHWREGERWFWDCLVDADLANNSSGWQWVSGCGVDAAPYFRIFNPVTQGQKFDPDGSYIRNYIPELKKLDKKYIFSPWEAPAHILENAGINLGKTYPKPIVDLKDSRVKALDAFKSIGK